MANDRLRVTQQLLTDEFSKMDRANRSVAATADNFDRTN